MAVFPREGWGGSVRRELLLVEGNKLQVPTHGDRGSSSSSSSSSSSNSSSDGGGDDDDDDGSDHGGDDDCDDDDGGGCMVEGMKGEDDGV